jgi:hypothetical protein
MSMTYKHAYRVLALAFALAIPACGGSDPQSPANTASISGTVVFDATGSPAAGVDVVLETSGIGMMMGDHWYQSEHMMTESHGQFHFEYMNDATHQYRVGVRGRSDWHMCDGTASDEDSVVLRIPSPHP